MPDGASGFAGISTRFPRPSFPLASSTLVWLKSGMKSSSLPPCTTESLPPVDPTLGSSRVNRLPFFTSVAATNPEGRIWNSAALVVSTTGPPSRTSTAISDGFEGDCLGNGGFVFEQLRMPAMSRMAVPKKNNEARLRYHWTRCMPPPTSRRNRECFVTIQSQFTRSKHTPGQHWDRLDRNETDYTDSVPGR